jgi:hypothetical protein
MTGFARIPVLPDATLIDALSAQLRRPLSRSARPLNVDPRHSTARDQRPLRVRPKSARDYSQSAATMIAALGQARFRAVHFGGYVALAPL